MAACDPDAARYRPLRHSTASTRPELDQQSRPEQVAVTSAVARQAQGQQNTREGGDPAQVRNRGVFFFHILLVNLPAPTATAAAAAAAVAACWLPKPGATTRAQKKGSKTKQKQKMQCQKMLLVAILLPARAQRSNCRPSSKSHLLI
ncbi:hypothetical protein GTR04_7470 [Trichophyton interdigitale]|nr:hypothetical protein GY631_7470 [Trichophyton interdigitale]KAG5216569.1 hypothetical protein GY632_7424 [Trichophyton interdigitale]KAG8205147.1 hypothetical protein GTR04_7470 [Trichophyton interdigitale]